LAGISIKCIFALFLIEGRRQLVQTSTLNLGIPMRIPVANSALAIRLASQLITKSPDGMPCVPRRDFTNALRAVTNGVTPRHATCAFVSCNPEGKPCVPRRIFGNQLQAIGNPTTIRQQSLNGGLEKPSSSHSLVTRWLNTNPVESVRPKPVGVRFADPIVSTTTEHTASLTSHQPNPETWQKPLLEKFQCSAGTVDLAQRRLDALESNLRSDPKFSRLSVRQQREALLSGGERALTKLGSRLRHFP
jgi:hypothetical protein